MRCYIIFCILFYLNLSTNAITNKRNVIICENQKLTLKCESNEILNILDGNYGRTSGEVCPNGPVKHLSCRQNTTVDVLKELCDGNNECEIHATNNLFGDPCVHTFKYLHILYDCVPKLDFKQETICEHQSIKLKCNKNKFIQIAAANYGRTNGNICPNGPIKEVNCLSGSSKDILSELCNNKKSCDISASNSVFGDTCYGTLKYLSVKYSCTKKQQKQNNKCNNGTLISPLLVCDGVKDCRHGEDELVCLTKNVCEHELLTIGCPSHHKIKVLYATYGRTYKNICPNNNIKKDMKCNAVTSKDIAEQRCNDQNKCEIHASNSVFGDPCHGVVKYLQVKYTCEPDVDSNIFPK